MPQDALNSFRSLLEKVPDWIADLQKTLDNTAQRQNGLLSANQPTDSVEPLSGEVFSKRSSVKAVRPEDRLSEHATTTQENDPKTQPHILTLLRPQIPHMTESDALRLSQRKRKTFSACSRVESGPAKYRSRSMAVVYYDGEVQSRFADLVRALNYCRNDIRRSKLSAKVDTVTRSGSSSSRSVGEDTTNNIAAFKTARMRLQEVMTEKVPDDNEALKVALDKVDGLLEKSQGFCEDAAHQVLRDGDCALEVTQAKENLEQAKASAERELPELERIVAEAEARRLETEERQQSESPSKSPVPSQDEKFELVSPLSPGLHEGPLEVDDIEVDDDDDDDTDAELDMAALKLPTNLMKYSMRSTRLTAC
ncbi:hypothetical protein Q7P37_006702 [Cladosporium fusiforme]